MLLVSNFYSPGMAYERNVLTCTPLISEGRAPTVLTAQRAAHACRLVANTAAMVLTASYLCRRVHSAAAHGSSSSNAALGSGSPSARASASSSVPAFGSQAPSGSQGASSSSAAATLPAVSPNSGGAAYGDVYHAVLVGIVGMLFAFAL